MTRPAGSYGEVRTALVDALRTHGPMPLCDLAARSQVGLDAASMTVKNAVRYGAMQIVGHKKMPHCTKWVAVYDLASEEAPDEDLSVGMLVLGNALSAWR